MFPDAEISRIGIKRTFNKDLVFACSHHDSPERSPRLLPPVAGVSRSLVHRGTRPGEARRELERDDKSCRSEAAWAE